MSEDRYITPVQYARRLGCKPETIRSWILRGELRAVNTGNRTRPRFKISPDAIVDFEERRSGKRSEKPARRKRREVIEFY
jgi:excisionase family DNA binding protein